MWEHVKIYLACYEHFDFFAAESKQKYVIEQNKHPDIKPAEVLSIDMIEAWNMI